MEAWVSQILSYICTGKKVKSNTHTDRFQGLLECNHRRIIVGCDNCSINSGCIVHFMLCDIYMVHFNIKSWELINIDCTSVLLYIIFVVQHNHQHKKKWSHYCQAEEREWSHYCQAEEPNIEWNIQLLHFFKVYVLKMFPQKKKK